MRSQHGTFQPEHKKRASYSGPTQYSFFNQRFRLALFVYNGYKEVAMEKNDIRTPHWVYDIIDDPNPVTGKK